MCVEAPDRDVVEASGRKKPPHVGTSERSLISEAGEPPSKEPEVDPSNRGFEPRECRDVSAEEQIRIRERQRRDSDQETTAGP